MLCGRIISLCHNTAAAVMTRRMKIVLLIVTIRRKSNPKACHSWAPNPPAAETSDILSSSSWWRCDHDGWAKDVVLMFRCIDIQVNFIKSWRPPIAVAIFAEHPPPPHGDNVITVGGGGHPGFTAVIQYHPLSSVLKSPPKNTKQRRHILYWFQQTGSPQEKQ